MKHFQEIDNSLLFSKNDLQDPRLGDIVQVHDPKEPGFVVCGYPDDEGVHLNGGRMGSSFGPDTIRRYFYKMTPGLFQNKTPKLYDIGNLNTEVDLPNRHENAKSTIQQLLENGHRCLTLGGGHDYGYPDGAGFLNTYAHNKPLILNFDAHLDVRPTDKGLSSGTPFYRLLNEYEFDFVELGIQSQCNSQAHLNWAREKGVKVLSWEELQVSGERLDIQVLRFLEPYLLKPRPTYLSVDIDGFSNAFAMGCSQSWAQGFNPESFLRILTVLAKRLDIKVFGIYEVAPPLDEDDKTSKLAALLLHHFLCTSN